MLFWLKMLSMAVMFVTSLTVKKPEIYWMFPLTAAVYVVTAIALFKENRVR